MKATLIVEGKEFPIEINDPELQKLIAPPKKTGYERTAHNAYYYFDGGNGTVHNTEPGFNPAEDVLYNVANYYSDKTVAENNVRADKLMRQLRRFAVEHRASNIEWGVSYNKYFIYYNHALGELQVGSASQHQYYNAIYFDSEFYAKAAIKQFYDKLVWYFTEYKNSL